MQQITDEYIVPQEGLLQHDDYSVKQDKVTFGSHFVLGKETGTTSPESLELTLLYSLKKLAVMHRYFRAYGYQL